MQFWFKCFGTMGYTALFFVAYVYLLKHPANIVTPMPLTVVDRWVPIQPFALPIYLSLWFYVSLPLMLMQTRSEIARYGLSITPLCLAGLGIFYFWPTATPAFNVDWSVYPGMAFLKGADAAGNACPSLHVAVAVFSAVALHGRARQLGMGRMVLLANVLWCFAIAYSTMATKQHVFVDVVAGAAMGMAFAVALLDSEETVLPATDGVAARR